MHILLIKVDFCVLNSFISVNAANLLQFHLLLIKFIFTIRFF